MTGTIYTIGHSNGTIDRLLGLLRQHGITAVADVRSQPYSRYNPQFNREVLAGALKDAELEYVFLGQELGARSDDPNCYRDGRAQYSLIAKTQVFERGIARLMTGMQRFQLAIICAEKEPLACHRTILVSRYLHDRGVKVLHILEGGALEDHDTLLQRLLQARGMQEQNLFHSKDELVDMAYEKQAEDIQYSANEESQTA